MGIFEANNLEHILLIYAGLFKPLRSFEVDDSYIKADISTNLHFVTLHMVSFPSQDKNKQKISTKEATMTFTNNSF